MAEVKIESVIEQIDSDMKRALEEAVNRLLPNAQIDRNELYREFRRAIGRKCSTWVRVRDDFVKKGCKHCGENT